MNDKSKTNAELVGEISILTQRIRELEQAESERKRAEKTSPESRALLESIIEGTTDAIYAKDLQGRYILFNAAAGRAVGKNAVDVLGKDDLTLFPPSEAQTIMEVDRQVLKGGMVKTYETVLTIATGQKVTYLSTKGPLFDAGGKCIGLFGLTRDITERKLTEEALRVSEQAARRLAQENELIAEIGRIISSTLEIEEVYERFAEKVSEAIPFDRIAVNTVNMKDYTRTIEYIQGDRLSGNRMGEVVSLAGTGLEQAIRTKSSLLLNSKSTADMKRKLLSALQFGAQSTMIIPLILKDEVIGHLAVHSAKIDAYSETDLLLAERMASQIAGAIANAQLFRERTQAEEALRVSEERYRELSIIDGLTQLYNSRYFYHQLKIEMERVDRYGQPLTLLLLDLDDFKRFNDAYGHVEGDQVLLRLGQVVKRCLRETDSAYRYGGEEFTVLLPMTQGEDGAVTAQRIRTEFKKEHFSPMPGQEVHVTVSIGLAQYKPPESIKVFVHRVDQLMYQGKKNGKDRVCCAS